MGEEKGNDSGVLEIWTVYDSPKDYPEMFVARKYLLDQPTEEVVTAKTLEAIREKLPVGLYRIPRDINDDAKIVESWL